MEITDVRLTKFNTENRCKAKCSVTFDNEFVVHGIRVIENADNELFIAMPSRTNKNTGKHDDVCHPINQECRDKIQKAVLEEYNNTPMPEAEETSDEEDK